jgi:hypothetical protein
VGVFNSDGGVGYTIINFEGFAGVLSALFTGFSPFGLRQEAAVAPQLSRRFCLDFFDLPVKQASVVV